MHLVLFDTWMGPLSGALTLDKSGPGIDGNKGVLYIPPSSSITGISPSDCLVSYPEHLLGGGDLTPLQKGRSSDQESSLNVVVNMLDCNIVESEFELQFRYYLCFQNHPLGKGMNLFISPPSYTLNRTINVLL